MPAEPRRPAGPSDGRREVDAYLAGTRPPVRAALGRLRSLIQDAAPGAEEVISYKMPAFREHGIVVYYAAFRDHCTLFLASVALRDRMEAAVAAYDKTGKGALHFTPEHPLPAALVRKLVRARVAENRARATTRRSPSPGSAPRRRRRVPSR